MNTGGDMDISANLTQQELTQEQHKVENNPTPELPPTLPQDSEEQSAKKRMKDLGRSAKSATKRALHIDDTQRQLHHRRNSLAHAVEDDAGLNPTKVLDTEKSTKQQIKEKLPIPHSLDELKELVRHPKASSQNQAADSLAVSENPHLRENEDNDLVDAHQQLADAHEKLKRKEQDGSDEGDTEDEAVLLRAQIQALEQDREEKRTAWISSRYVHSIRVLSSQEYKFPLLSSCRWVDESVEPQGARWTQWSEQLRTFLRHAIEPPPVESKRSREEDLETNTYDQDIILQETERILIASSPFQRWISRLRKMRRWQNPGNTAFWLTTWLIIWTCNRVFTFLYCYITFRALQRRTDFDNRETIKDAQERASDDNEMNNTFGEMITDLGSEHWLQPTLDMVGPSIQSSMRSVADWLEILHNYPEWMTPRAKRSIVAVMSITILMSLLFSTEFWFRACTLVSILFFFFDRPLAARYPKYRQALVPTHWILWEVPTSTETAFGYLRQQARAILLQSEGRVAQSKKEFATGIELFASTCVWNDIEGTAVLTMTDIRFMRKIPRQELWRRGYKDLLRLRKGEGRISPFHGTAHLVELHFKDGSAEKLEHLTKNDTLFNLIFAFSGLQWRQI